MVDFIERSSREVKVVGGRGQPPGQIFVASVGPEYSKMFQTRGNCKANDDIMIMVLLLEQHVRCKYKNYYIHSLVCWLVILNSTLHILYE